MWIVRVYLERGDIIEDEDEYNGRIVRVSKRFVVACYDFGSIYWDEVKVLS